jgi:hypothetical protein
VLSASRALEASIVTAAQANRATYAPAGPQAVLYDQMNNNSASYISSQENPPAEAAFAT